MGIKSCREVLEAHKDWELLAELPKKVGKFELTEPMELSGLELVFVRYTNGEKRSVEFIYTEETGDFVVVKSVGLFRFRDDRYYFRDDAKFAAEVQAHLPEIVADLDGQGQRYPAAVFGLDFQQWQDWQGLPRNIDDFELVITPDKPLKYINGSWVLFAYEDQKQGHQLAVFYNEFRNEVFGELKRGGVFEATGDFSLSFDEDGYQHKPEQFLRDVTKLIAKNLTGTLKKLSS